MQSYNLFQVNFFQKIDVPSDGSCLFNSIMISLYHLYQVKTHFGTIKI